MTFQIINTADRKNMPVEGMDGYQVYNGLDCCLTVEILEALEPLLDEDTAHVYAFERELQGPLMEMMARGVLIDQTQRRKMIKVLEIEKTRIEGIFQTFANAVWGKDLNPASPAQLKYFFYTVLRVPEIRTQGAGGKWEVSTNREALEKMQNTHFLARPICTVLLELRDVTKKLQTLQTGIDRDGRFRTNFNIASTVTGRLSSSENPFGTGGNLQNITGQLRRPFRSDPGKKLGYFDLQQAESRGVGLLAYLVTGRSTYLDACEAGDLHTVVAKLCWPRLAWTGNLSEDREIAEAPFYRMFSRRDLAKRGGHGSNYYGTPPTIARNLKIETKVAAEFQEAYFKAFPEISWWHDWTKAQLMNGGVLITPLRRVRQFFGRPYEGSTIRAAIAHTPQSMIADMVDQALVKIWYKYPQVELLMQIHDALVVQYPEELEEELVPLIIEAMTQRIEFDPFEVIDPETKKKVLAPGRVFEIGSDPMVGWNWAKATTPEEAAKLKEEANPYGLIKYKGKDKRKFVEPSGFDLLNQQIKGLTYA